MRKLLVLSASTLLLLGSCRKTGSTGSSTSPEPGYNYSVVSYDSVLSGDRLSFGRNSFMGLSVGTKVLFAGGSGNGGNEPTIHQTADVYDTIAKSWSRINLSSPIAGYAAATLNGRAYIGGGTRYYQGTSYVESDLVEIYDPIFNLFGVSTQSRLSQDRTGLTAAGTKDVILFAGGYRSGGNSSDAVDILETNTGRINTARLSIARYEMATGAAGNEILFAGGVNDNNSTVRVTDTVDIYNTGTQSWTVSRLSSPRTLVAGATAGSKIYFAGGAYINSGGNYIPTSVIDIYNTTSRKWESPVMLPKALFGLSAVTIGNLIVFAGGLDANLIASKDVYIFNTNSGTWQILQISIARKNIAMASSGNKVFIAGGSDQAFRNSRKVDILTAN